MTDGREQSTHQAVEQGADKERKVERQAVPLFHFDLAREVEQLRREDAWLKAGHMAKTLVKRADFSIVLFVLKAGARIEEHKTDASISIQALRGRLLLRLPEREVDLFAGHLLALDRAVPHAVEAVEEGAFLLSISRSQAAEIDS